MAEITIFLVLAMILLVLYSAALVTYYTVISDYFSLGQKIAIVAIAWFVPILGPAFILHILSQDKLIDRRRGVPWLNYLFVSGFLVQLQGDSQSNSAINGDTNAGTFEIEDADT